MAIDLDQQTLKIVAQFTTTANENAVRSEWDGLVNSIGGRTQQTLDNDFRVGANRQDDLKFLVVGPDQYEVYPKFWLTGTTDLTQAELDVVVSDLLADIKVIISDSMTGPPFNVTDLLFHVHYQDGRAPVADEI